MWLHCPASCRGASRKLCHPWSGPYKVVKKLSDYNYRIEKLQGRRDRKFVYFDRLKLCPKDIRLDDDHPIISASPHRYQDCQQPERQPVGYDIELVDGDEDESETRMSNTAQPDLSRGLDTTIAAGPPVTNSRYPRRNHRVSSRFHDFVSISCVKDETSFSRGG